VNADKTLRASKMSRTKSPRRLPLGFLVAMAIVVIACTVTLARQRQESALLRAERDLGRFEMRQLEELRRENSRLRESRISAAELATLRADHAALPRLRAELDAISRRPSPE
jgi:type II secretory pathway pseudopilin PulG